MQTEMFDNSFIKTREENMTYNEYLKWLKKQGVKVVNGKGRHYKKATLNGKEVPIPYHGAKEIGEGVRRKINKELGL